MRYAERAATLERIAPGRLYALLSAEFRRVTEEDCGWCRMPLLTVGRAQNAHGGHWVVEPATTCERCVTAMREIVERYARRYDVWPVYADSPLEGAPPRAPR